MPKIKKLPAELYAPDICGQRDLSNQTLSFEFLPQHSPSSGISKILIKDHVVTLYFPESAHPLRCFIQEGDLKNCRGDQADMPTKLVYKNHPIHDIFHDEGLHSITTWHDHLCFGYTAMQNVVTCFTEQLQKFLQNPKAFCWQFGTFTTYLHPIDANALRLAYSRHLNPRRILSTQKSSMYTCPKAKEICSVRFFSDVPTYQTHDIPNLVHASSARALLTSAVALLNTNLIAAPGNHGTTARPIVQFDLLVAVAELLCLLICGRFLLHQMQRHYRSLR
jgi:hypothetical protein